MGKNGMMEALQREARGDKVRPVVNTSASVTVADEVLDSSPAPRRKRGEGKATGSANPSRAGRVNVTGYFDPSVKQSIRMIQAQFPQRLTEQDLLAEALDDLFSKYKVPQTAKR